MAVRYALLAALLALSLPADEPWKSEPYLNWSEQEVKRILKDSPWARLVMTAYHPIHGSGETIETHPGVAIGKAPKNVDDPMRPPDAETETFRPKGYYIVRWESSRTIRRALYRQAVLNGEKPRGNPDDKSSQDSEEYVLTLTSEPQTEWPTNDPALWRRLAELVGKKNGRRVVPRDVQVRGGLTGISPLTITFHFPRMTEAGLPLVDDGETSIEFSCQVGPRVFQAKFDPRKMIDRSGRDL